MWRFVVHTQIRWFALPSGPHPGSSGGTRESPTVGRWSAGGLHPRLALLNDRIFQSVWSINEAALPQFGDFPQLFGSDDKATTRLCAWDEASLVQIETVNHINVRRGGHLQKREKTLLRCVINNPDLFGNSGLFKYNKVWKCQTCLQKRATYCPNI